MRKTPLVLLFSFGLAATAHAQIAKPSDLLTVGGFLDVCGAAKGQFSEKSEDAINKASPSEVNEAIKNAFNEKMANDGLCMGFLNGLREGWREGHEHGVIAAHFRIGVPLDLTAGLKALPSKELEAINKEMKNDIPCTPEHMTFGDLKEAVVRYFRAQLEKNPSLRTVRTSHLFPAAVRDAFPCQPQDTPPAGAKRQPKIKNPFQPATEKQRVGL
jgi:hypothetical protein